jgi:hypothetical protein
MPPGFRCFPRSVPCKIRNNRVDLMREINGFNFIIRRGEGIIAANTVYFIF